MALVFTDALRTALAAELLVQIDTGPAAAKVVIYSDADIRPAKPSDSPGASVVLAELNMQDPSFTAGGAGILNAALPITDPDGANASGTASWFRVLDGNGAGIIDGDVGTSGSDLNLNTTLFTAGLDVDITSFILAIGNS